MGHQAFCVRRCAVVLCKCTYVCKCVCVCMIVSNLMCKSSGAIHLSCLLWQDFLLGHGIYWLGHVPWPVSHRDLHIHFYLLGIATKPGSLLLSLTNDHTNSGLHTCSANTVSPELALHPHTRPLDELCVKSSFLLTPGLHTSVSQLAVQMADLTGFVLFLLASTWSKQITSVPHIWKNAFLYILVFVYWQYVLELRINLGM